MSTGIPSLGKRVSGEVLGGLEVRILLEAQSIRDLVEEALAEVMSERAVAIHPVIGPIEQFEDEERYRIQFLDSCFGDNSSDQARRLAEGRNQTGNRFPVR